MAKKFGKALFLTAAVASAAAAVYFYLQKRDDAQKDLEEDDYDDFSEDSDREPESARNYVPLNHEVPTDKNAEIPKDGSEEACGKEDSGEAASTEEFPIGKPSEDTSSSSGQETTEKESTFTPLTEQVAQAAEKAADSVEEFFDEEDGPDVEPPLHDN